MLNKAAKMRQVEGRQTEAVKTHFSVTLRNIRCCRVALLYADNSQVLLCARALLMEHILHTPPTPAATTFWPAGCRFAAERCLSEVYRTLAHPVLYR